MTLDIDMMKYYYSKGLWSKERLDKLLAAGKITQEQYNTIINGK